jgi:hypothetical protein
LGAWVKILVKALIWGVPKKKTLMLLIWMNLPNPPRRKIILFKKRLQSKKNLPLIKHRLFKNLRMPQ